MALALCIGAIVIAVALGERMKMNTGIVAMFFAFLIGYFLLGKQIEEIIMYWPVDIMFYLLSISLFFNYAALNGTMEVLGRKMLGVLGGRRALVPWAITLVCAVVGGLGAGASTPAIVGPFAFSMALSSGINPALTALCILFGNLIGSNNPYNGYGGIISKNLIIANGVDPETATAMSNRIWLNCSLMCVVVIGIFFAYYMIKDRKKGAGTAEAEKQEAAELSSSSFNPKQKITLAILLVAFVLMVVPGVVKTWFPSPFWDTVAGICKPQAVMVAGALLCAILGLGKEEEIIRKVPIHTIVMISGVYMLIEIGVQAGLVEQIGQLLQETVPAAIVPGVIVLLAAALSFFSSTTSTVMPLMYPLVPQLAAAVGLSPVALYSCIFLGGLSTDVSPFSTGGALAIAGCPGPGIKDELASRLIGCSLAIPFLVMAAAQLGLFNLAG